MRRKTDQDVYFKRDNSIFLRGSDLLVLGRKIFSFIPSLDSISIRFLDPIIFIQTSLISCLFLLSPFHLLFISFLYQQPRVSSFLSSLSSYLLVLDSHSFCRPHHHSWYFSLSLSCVERTLKLRYITRNEE